ncbi:MAG: hypothetical protein WD607_11510 [Candidatus Paceibacterota bacterium]
MSIINSLPVSDNMNEPISGLDILPDQTDADFSKGKYFFESGILTDFQGYKYPQQNYLDSKLPQKDNLIDIKINGDIIGEVSYMHKELKTEIEESKYIIELEESWDDGGAKKIPEVVYRNAIDFLIKYVNYIEKNFQLALSTPEINPCVDGSIDLSFRTEKARMLINIQNEDNANAVFYGDLYESKVPIKGMVPIENVYEHLASWMKELA